MMLGDEEYAKAFSAKLFEHGVFASPIVFPMARSGSFSNPGLAEGRAVPVSPSSLRLRVDRSPEARRGCA